MRPRRKGLEPTGTSKVIKLKCARCDVWICSLSLDPNESRITFELFDKRFAKNLTRLGGLRAAVRCPQKRCNFTFLFDDSTWPRALELAKTASVINLRELI